jgi:hypothetical protein
VDEPIALAPGEGIPLKTDRPELSLLEVTFILNLHTPGGFAQYRRELAELRAQGIEPDREFFERHDVFDV